MATSWRPSAPQAALLALIVLVLCLDPGGRQQAAAQTSESINVAGIVVNFGDGRLTYALVPFEEDDISGVELLQRSGLDLLTIEFGAMGEGVCTIEQTGCDLSACRARLCQTGNPDSPFWHYARQSSQGEWTLAPLGASSSIVEDGDVDGWFWSAEDPATRAHSVDEIASLIGVDLEDFRTDTVSGDEPLLLVTGEHEDDQSASDQRRDAIAAAAVIAGLIAIGGFAIWRSRRIMTP